MYLIIGEDQLLSLQDAVDSYMENAESDRKNGVDMEGYSESMWTELKILLDKAWAREAMKPIYSVAESENGTLWMVVECVGVHQGVRMMITHDIPYKTKAAAEHKAARLTAAMKELTA